MPEGPSIVILKEAVQPFCDKRVVKATSTTEEVAAKELQGKIISGFKTWGKHFLICFDTISVRVHLLLFGSYSINEVKENRIPRLSLGFSHKQSINFYACSIKVIRKPLDDVYDWTADIMNGKWNSAKALKKLVAIPETLVCDALLDQMIFAGVGNIIKNEVLYRVRVHPGSKVGKIPAAKKRQIAREIVTYSFQFLEWKKESTLKKHWLVISKKVCSRDGHVIRKEYLGKTNRRTFFCPHCQKLYE